MSKRDPQKEPAAPADGDSKLSLEDTIAQKMRGVPGKTRTGVVGYNPYDAVPAIKPNSDEVKPKPTDLRKLSEWIRLQRQVAELKSDKPKKEKD
ncbi:MAG TPA: hypothetical protein VIH80_06105 [Steroidobacteraceae bacterium]